MEGKRSYLSPPLMDGDEQKYILEAFDTNRLAPLGPHVDAFEQETAAYVGGKHTAALMSGPSALCLAVKPAGVKPGGTVFCSDLTSAWGLCLPSDIPMTPEEQQWICGLIAGEPHGAPYA